MLILLLEIRLKLFIIYQLKIYSLIKKINCSFKQCLRYYINNKKITMQYFYQLHN